MAKGLKVAALEGFIKGKLDEAAKAGAVRFSLDPKGKVKPDHFRLPARKAGLVLVENGPELTLCVLRAA